MSSSPSTVVAMRSQISSATAASYGIKWRPIAFTVDSGNGGGQVALIGVLIVSVIVALRHVVALTSLLADAATLAG